MLLTRTLILVVWQPPSESLSCYSEFRAVMLLNLIAIVRLSSY